MAVYAAVNLMRGGLAEIVDNCRVWPSNYSSYMENFKFLEKELKSFQEFVERLDMNSRVRMKALLQGIPEVIDQFTQNTVISYLEQSSDIEQDAHCPYRCTGHESEYQESLDLHFKQEAQSFIDTLKKVKEECLKQHTHGLAPIEDHEAHVDSKSEMVGLSDEYAKLKKEIFARWVPGLFFSLAGMTGIGKTALAKKLFQDLDVLEWFDYLITVTVGRKYQPEQITQTILAQLSLDSHDMLTEGCLRESLTGKRYLILLDDVWDMELIKGYLETSFPDTKNGSRVLLTTRIQRDSFSYHPINMRLLNKDESWHLLRVAVFDQNSCPPELEEAGKKIAEKCDGLPLTILTVANLLSRRPELSWIEVATHKKHQIFIDTYDEISKVLYPIYEDLRDDLKLCFLYMGVFPQYYEISKSKLINLWIVEKIIGKGLFQTLKVSSVECLQYLALHSLVMVYKRSTTPYDDLIERVKTGRLHSSWWHFCHKEARKDNFYHVLDGFEDASEEVLKNQTRITIHNNVLFAIKEVYNSMEEHCASTMDSLLCLGPYHQYPVPICFGLKLLKKLDALNIRFYDFPLEVLELIKLRYLALTCKGSLPSSISKLWKLQYLIIHRHLSIKFGAPSYLPVEIWDMERLIHLDVTGSDLPDVDVGGTCLPNLLTLLGVSFDICTSGAIRRIPNLKKLGIQIDLMPHEVEPLCYFDYVSHLTELESLKYVIVNPARNLVVAPLAPLSMISLHLKKLHLNGLSYPWEQMSTIASLPNLEVLKLRCNAFQGEYWEVKKDEFPKLSFLLMEDIDLVILDTCDTWEGECFKCLTKVSIIHCYKLRKLRLSLSCYGRLQKIEVIDCNPSIEKSITNKLQKADKKLSTTLLVKSSWYS